MAEKSINSEMHLKLPGSLSFSLYLLISVCAKSRQSCLALCDLKDRRLSGSSVHGILQVRMLERVAISSYRGIFPTQGLNSIPYVSCTGRQVLYHQHHLGSPICYTTSFSSLKFSEIYDKLHIVIYYPFFSMICQITAQLGPPSVVLEANLGNYLQSYLLPSQSHLLYQHLHNTSNCPFVSQMFF